MNPSRTGPIHTPGGQPSDPHLILEPAIRAQGCENTSENVGSEACKRALFLLDSLHRHQECLPQLAALAWERAAFSEALSHPEPGRRIRRFLKKA